MWTGQKHRPVRVKMTYLHRRRGTNSNNSNHKSNEAARGRDFVGLSPLGTTINFAQELKVGGQSRQMESRIIARFSIARSPHLLMGIPPHQIHPSLSQSPLCISIHLLSPSLSPVQVGLGICDRFTGKKTVKLFYQLTGKAPLYR